MTSWTLRGATTSYVVGVSSSNEWAELVAWGPHGVEDGPSIVAPVGQVHYLPEADVAPVEYAVRGVRYTAPTELVVLGPDGSDESRSVFVEAVEGPNELALTFVDALRSLRIVLHYRVQLDVVERWVDVHNDGSEALTLRAHDSAAFVVPTSGGALLRYLWGQWNGEFQQESIALTRGRFVVDSLQGATGHSYSPFVTVSDLEDPGGTTWGVQLAWSGSWHLTTDVDTTGQTRIQAGRAASTVGISLVPGATWTSPLALGACSAEGPDGVARVFHAYQRASSARLELPRKVLYNSWEATEFDVRASAQLELASRAAEIGVETFVVDDGWFVGRSGDTAGLGDWYVDPEAFPDGLDAFISQLAALGMGFGLWVEPESVSPSSELAAKHPEWILRTEGREPILVRNQLLLDLSRPDVAAWIWETLDRLLSTYDITYLKWDANRPRLDTGDLRGRDVDGLAVEHLYGVLERLRTDHPGVFVEGCAGGGARVDAGMAARVDILWPSDNTAPLDRLRIQRGFLSGYAPHLLSSWVTDAVGTHDRRTRDLDFRFHVAMAGGLGIGADLSRWSADQLATASRWIAQYKEIRSVIATGSLHWLTRPDDPTVAAQYVGETRSVVFAWDTGDRSYRGTLPTRPRRIPLKGLSPEQLYRVGDETLPGSYLMAVGVPDPRDSPADSLCLVVEPVD